MQHRLYRILLCWYALLNISTAYPESALATAAARAEAQEAQLQDRIPFTFNQEPLANVVNLVAAHKKMNIIFPADQTFKNQKVTFHNDHEVTIDEALTITYTLLDLAGYTITREGPEHTITPIANNAFNKEVLELFINVTPEELPVSSVKRIRAVFYLSNILVPSATAQPSFGATTETPNPISLILKDMIPGADAQPGSATPSPVIFDQQNNAIIITERANTIAAAMKVINALDSLGVQESVEIIPLYNAAARTVASFFKGLISQGQTTPGIYGRQQRPRGSQYFSPSTTVLPEDRTNVLIVMGRQEEVNRVRELVQEYIDVPPDSGDSIIHIYDLQFLEAKAFRDVLDKLVNPQGEGAEQPGGPQSTQVTTGTGPRRLFENPIIWFEQYEQIKTTADGQENDQESPIRSPFTSPTDQFGDDSDSSSLLPQLKEQQPPYQGGNRLIVAARKKDWEQIKALIRKLDVPRRQLIANVLVVDCFNATDKNISTSIRNPKDMNLPRGVDFHAAHVPAFSAGSEDGGLAPDDAMVYKLQTLPDGTQGFTPNSTLATDLMLFLAQNPGQTIAGNPPTLPGSFMATFTDPSGNGIWTALRIFRASSNFRVLSHPYLIVTDNQQALIQLVNIRRDNGDPTSGANGVVTVPIVDVTAKLAVGITPRISSLTRANLQVNISINDFQAPATTNNFTRTTREIQTNLNMSTDQIIAFGGLAQLTHRIAATKTNPLDKIPIFGWLFKSVTQEVVKSDLLVMIGISIFDPFEITIPNRYTTDTLLHTEPLLTDRTVLDTPRDPITRSFFRQKDAQDDFANRYLDDAGSAGIRYRFNQEKELDRDRLTCQQPPDSAYIPRDRYAKKIEEIVADEDSPLAVNAPQGQQQ